MKSEKAFERAMDDLNPSMSTLEVLYEVLSWFEEPGLNIFDIKQLLIEKIEVYEK